MNTRDFLRGVLVLSLIVLAACGGRPSRTAPYDRLIAQDPSAQNYYSRGASLCDDYNAALDERRKGLDDVEKAISLDEGKAWYHVKHGVFCAQLFKATREAAYREKSLASFAVALKREPGNLNWHLWHGTALLTFDQPEEAETALRTALRICQAGDGSTRKCYETDVFEQLAAAYQALAKKADGKPEQAQYLELAKSADENCTRWNKIKWKETAEYFAAQKRAKDEAREREYATWVERHGKLVAEAERQAEEERRYWATQKECEVCNGRGWHFRMGSTEHHVDTIKTDKGTVIRSKTTTVPGGCIACWRCFGQGHYDKE